MFGSDPRDRSEGVRRSLCVVLPVARPPHVPRVPFGLDPLIAEAKQWVHQRRTLVFAIVVMIGGGAVGATVALTASTPSQAITSPLRVDNSYLGLDCGSAFPCPKLGIALWLHAPAVSVTVMLHGRSVALTSPRGDHRLYWQGFVRDTAAERIAGDMKRLVRLAVEATGRDGTIRRATLRSPVSPGWG